MLILFLLIFFSSFIVFWGFASFFQGWLYQTVATMLPARAAIAALVFSMFLTFWVFINSRPDAENRYGSLLEFKTASIKEVSEFTAIRTYRLPRENGSKEASIKYTREPQGDFVDPSGKKYQLVSSDFMTTAIQITDKSNKDYRFEAEFRQPMPPEIEKRSYTPEKIFKDKSGSYVSAERPWTISTPSTASVVGTILLHIFLIVVLFLAFWPALKFTALHSAGLAFFTGIAIVVALLPLLFAKTAKPVKQATSTEYRSSYIV